MYEYQVIPAPRRGKKAQGIKGTDARFAHTMEELLNEAATEGWEYVRTDTLPNERRSIFNGRSTVYQNMLVFRRPFEKSVEQEGVVEEVQATPPIEEKIEEGAQAPALPSAQEANKTSDAAPAVKRKKA